MTSSLWIDLDHTADVQCHAWGDTLEQAFENMAECMLNYMTDINLIKIDPEESQEMTVIGTPFLPFADPLITLYLLIGHDMESLLYNYMNELLYRFISDSFCAVKVRITNLDRITHTLHAQL